MGWWNIGGNLVEEIVEGGEKTAAGAILDQQGLHFKTRRVKQIVERGVLINILLVDFHSSLNEGVRNFFVRYQHVRLGVVACAEHGPVQRGSSRGSVAFRSAPPSISPLA